MAQQGVAERLPRLVGIRKAKELLYTGDMISADEAERLHLVNQVVPREKLLSAAEELAAKIADKSPVATASVKALVHDGMDVGLKTGLELERGAVVRHHGTKDIIEGISAFLEKRKPKFSGE